LPSKISFPIFRSPSPPLPSGIPTLFLLPKGPQKINQTCVFLGVTVEVCPCYSSSSPSRCSLFFFLFLGSLSGHIFLTVVLVFYYLAECGISSEPTFVLLPPGFRRNVKGSFSLVESIPIFFTHFGALSLQYKGCQSALHSLPRGPRPVRPDAPFGRNPSPSPPY